MSRTSNRGRACHSKTRARVCNPPLSRALQFLSGLMLVSSAHAAAPELVAASTAATTSQILQGIEVLGNYNNAIGTSDAASQGSVTAQLIESRPTLRPGELLEFVPGLIVTQHSGDGKANQYYLRGFNLDHGTDFATFVDGMPVNMRTHAHGHGYTDVNFLIPEIVSRIDYKKGPYYADEGDFASAGAAHLALKNTLGPAAQQGIAEVTAGENGYGRAMLAQSFKLDEGKLLYALELAHNNGPWEVPENFRKQSGVLRYSFGDADHPTSITAMAYQARWTSTDQIPQRAVDQGLVGRYGALDPSDGGRTARYSLSFDTKRIRDDGVFELSAYAIQSRLNLYSQFTYFLDDPVDGDQFEQAERRKVYGFEASQSWSGKFGSMDMSNKIGVQVRYDRLSPVGLYSTVARERLSTTQESQVSEGSAALYAQNTLQWTPWLRSVAGLRTDYFKTDVDSSIAANTGHKSDGITSPKLSLIFGPWAKTEAFFNIGTGFHSNDARGAVATLSPKDLLPIDPANLLVRSKGMELGARSEFIPGLQSSLTMWQLKLDSELVFSGDAGNTEPSRASKRYGIEFNNHYVARSWLFFDVDLAASHARFSEDDPINSIGNYIPGSVDKVASAGMTITNLGPWSGQLQLRYFGPRPLIEDNSQRSLSTTLTYARVGYQISKNWKLSLDVFNLFDRKASDIDYYYTSRLQGEPAGGVDDVHFHPVEPRNFRLTLATQF